MNQYHAQVCIAPSLEQADIPQALKTKTTDVTHILCDRLSIDQVRTLIQQAQCRPLGGDKRFFVIVTRFLPHESQNALLKLFEEPPYHARFYLVIPQEGILLPTLRSRMFLRDTECVASSANTCFDDFLQASYAERLNIVADMVKKKDSERLEGVILGVEQFVETQVTTYDALARAVLQARHYLQAPGASAKMLLEDIALLLPRVS